MPLALRTDRSDPAWLQAEYYARTAGAYNSMHVGEADEHAIALGLLSALIVQRRLCSVLDIGCGTGRALHHLKRVPGLVVHGIEPVKALREIACRNGISPVEITEGSALELPFEDGSFNVVCSFGVLHHIKDHRRAVSEMCRVARRAVFISDSNNLGQGSQGARIVKWALKAAGLWPVFELIRTRGKGYHYSDGDGVFYSYTLLDDVPILRRKFPDVLWLGTSPSGPALNHSAGSIAVLAALHEDAADARGAIA